MSTSSYYDNASIAEKAAMNMKRCVELDHAVQQMKYWKGRVNTLKAQHKQAAIIASLEESPARTWNNLTKKDKWKKSHVLIVFQKLIDSSTSNSSSSFIELPALLKEDNFQRNAPKNIINDKDIFLARIQTSHCQNYYNRYRSTIITTSASYLNQQRQQQQPKHLIIPESLREDKSVWIRVLSLYPDLLCQADYNPSRQQVESSSNSHSPRGVLDYEDVDDFYISYEVENISNSKSDVAKWLPEGIYKDEDLFVAFLQGVQQQLHRLDRENIKTTIARFDYCLRNDPKVVLHSVESFNEGTRFDMTRLLLETCGMNSSSILTNQQRQQHQTIIRNNKNFVLKLIDNIKLPNNGLKFFSKRLKDDHDVVLACVQNNGRCLKDASYKMRRNLSIAKAACDQCPFAVLYSHGDARKKLENDRKRVLSLFEYLQNEESKGLGFSTIAGNIHDLPDFGTSATIIRKFWKSLRKNLQNDRDIAMAALLGHSISVDELPSRLRYDYAFWAAAISKSPAVWYNLPEPYNDDEDLVRLIPFVADEPMLFQLYHKFPDTFSERDMWIKILSSPFIENDDGLLNVLLDMAPDYILRDKEIVLRVVRQDYSIMKMIGEPLCDDREVISAAIESSSEAIFGLTPMIQMMYPDLLAKAILRFDDGDDIWEIYDFIADDLWTNRDVAKAWVTRGGDYLHEEFPDEFEHDEELFLLIAEHNPQDFWCSSEELCSNKDFMIKVVTKNPSMIRECCSNLSKDFDIALMAFGSGGCNGNNKIINSNNLAGRFDINDPDDFKLITDFAQQCRNKLSIHDNFVKNILCSISVKKKKVGRQRNNNNQCRLRLLDQGNETAIAYKKLLADYIGVPQGEELRLLRQASANLARWGY